jgi:hypothetical protein
MHMTAHQTSPTRTARQDPLSDARRRERWILLARSTWLALVVLTLGVFFASLPIYLAQLQTPCAPTACQYQQLTQAQGETLTRIGWSVGAYAAVTLALLLAISGVSLVVSTLIIWRRPDDRMALLVALLLVTLGPTGVTATAPETSPWLVLDNGVTFLTEAFLLLVFSLFPTGRFVPRWMRWNLVVFLGVQVLSPFFPAAPFSRNTSVYQLGWLVVLSELALVTFFQVYRYWRLSTALERQQTKWVVFGLAGPTLLNVLVSGLALLFPEAVERHALLVVAYNEVGSLLALAVPLSFGVAILRYRLWDIDTLINRALVYGLLTGLLASIYAGLIIGLQALASTFTGQTGASPLVIVVSTLAIAALVRPVRRRIQALIDWRFYRHKYDAEKTLATFSAMLHQELHLEQVCERLLVVVQETMQPAHVSLWLHQPERQPTELVHRLEPHSQTPTRPRPG